MRYSVNLLPHHHRRKKGLQTRYLLSGIAAVVILLLAGVHSFVWYNIQRAKYELAQIDQRIEILQPALQQVQKNKVLKSRIDTRKEIITQISKERPRKWSEIIQQLGYDTPENLWLIQVASDANGAVLIRGGADDIDTVSTYVTNLKKNPNFMRVSFQSLTRPDTNADSKGEMGVVAPLDAVTYEVSLQVKGGEGI